MLGSLSYAKKPQGQADKQVTVANTEKSSFMARRKQIKQLIKKYKKAPANEKPAIKAELTQVVSVHVDAQLAYMKERWRDAQPVAVTLVLMPVALVEDIVQQPTRPIAFSFSKAGHTSCIDHCGIDPETSYKRIAVEGANHHPTPAVSQKSCARTGNASPSTDIEDAERLLGHIRHQRRVATLDIAAHKLVALVVGRVAFQIIGNLGPDAVPDNCHMGRIHSRRHPNKGFWLRLGFSLFPVVSRPRCAPRNQYTYYYI